GVFYPPQWAALLGPQVPAVMAYLFAHLLLGGLGSMRLARAFGASHAGSAVAGLAWSLSGYATSEWISGIRLVSSAWLPWAAVAVVPAAVAARATDRAAPVRAAGDRLSLPVARLPELAAAGGLGRAWLVAPAAMAPYFGDAPLAHSVYLGAAVLALALFAPYR